METIQILEFQSRVRVPVQPVRTFLPLTFPHLCVNILFYLFLIENDEKIGSGVLLHASNPSTTRPT
jgi:hypothetical protein